MRIILFILSLGLSYGVFGAYPEYVRLSASTKRIEINEGQSVYVGFGISPSRFQFGEDENGEPLYQKLFAYFSASEDIVSTGGVWFVESGTSVRVTGIAGGTGVIQVSFAEHYFTPLYKASNQIIIPIIVHGKPKLNGDEGDVLAETPGRPGSLPCPNMSAGTSMVHNSRLDHHHDAFDYMVKNSNTLCEECGVSFPKINSLPQFYVKRIHRYRMQEFRGSFGPGVFSNFDIQLHLYGSNKAEIFDPQKHFELDLEDAGGSGTYINSSHSAIKHLQLFDAANTLTANQSSARTAVLSYHNGTKNKFELFAADDSGLAWSGRLTSQTDRNGNGYTLTYQDANPLATFEELGFDRSKLWRIARVTDAYNMSADFYLSMG